MTRALGIAACKGAGASLACEAEVAEHRLCAADQHLILASSGVWEVVGPTDAALRTHFYEKARAGKRLQLCAAHTLPPAATHNPPHPTHPPNAHSRLSLSRRSWPRPMQRRRHRGAAS